MKGLEVADVEEALQAVLGGARGEAARIAGGSR